MPETDNLLDQAELTDNGFLNNRLKCLQPKKGYRAGLDAVFVAACVPAKTGDRIFEAGIGTGIAALCLLHRIPDTTVTGVEINAEYAAIARENAVRNDFADNLKVIESDVVEQAAKLEAGSFDHAFSNPPFRELGKARLPKDRGRHTAFVGDLATIEAWTAAMVRLVKPGGTVTMILPAELSGPFLELGTVSTRSLKILPLAPKSGACPNRYIYRLQSAAEPTIIKRPAFVIHNDDTSFSNAADRILRCGEAAEW